MSVISSAQSINILACDAFRRLPPSLKLTISVRIHPCTCTSKNIKGVSTSRGAQPSAADTGDANVGACILGALAEFEQDIIRARTKAGLAAARPRGRKGGRPTKLSTKKNKLQLNSTKNENLTPKQTQGVFS